MVDRRDIVVVLGVRGGDMVFCGAGVVCFVVLE